jgi:hypothetical protein
MIGDPAPMTRSSASGSAVISALFAASDRASRTIHPASRDMIRYPRRNATNPIMPTIAPDTDQKVTGAMGFLAPTP